MNREEGLSSLSKLAIAIIFIVIISFFLQPLFGVGRKGEKERKGNYDPNKLIEGRTLSDLDKLSATDTDRIEDLIKGNKSEKPLVLISYVDSLDSVKKEIFLTSKKKYEDSVDIVLIPSKAMNDIDSTISSNKNSIRIYDKDNNLPSSYLGNYSDLGFYILENNGEDIAIQSNSPLNSEQLDILIKYLKLE